MGRSRSTLGSCSSCSTCSCTPAAST
jgi:hypothetical protein